MARKPKHEEHEEHANHERWVLSYADILTLLLALFIVMFAISKVDQKKFEEFAKGTAQGFGTAVAVPGEMGNLDGGDGVLKDQKPAGAKDAPAPPEESSAGKEAIQREQARAAAASAEKKNLEQIKKQISERLKKQGLSDAVQMTVDSRGLVVNIVTDKVLFDTGQADLRPAGTKVLDAIAPALKELPNYVSVEGHTDNVPISGSYRSNWFLSTARASMVTEQLIKDGIPADRVSPAGFADTRPLGSNGSEAGRSRNRRVAVVVLPYLPDSKGDAGLAAADGTTGGGDVTPTTPSVAPSAPLVAPTMAAPAA